jgi:hypothetical protein
LGEFAQIFLLLKFLFFCEALLHHGALLDFFASVPVGGEQGFGELRELVVDGYILKAAAIGGETLV